MWSHMPDTTSANAKPARPVVKPPKNRAERKSPVVVTSMSPLPRQREQRLDGDGPFNGEAAISPAAKLQNDHRGLLFPDNLGYAFRIKGPLRTQCLEPPVRSRRAPGCED